MAKGIISSLIAAIVFFVAGGISARILGTKEGAYSSMFGSFDELACSLLNTTVTDSGSWEFDGHKVIKLGSSNADMRVEPIDGDKITLSVSEIKRRIHVTVSESENSEEIAISICKTSFFGFSFGPDCVAVIGLPKTIYDSLETNIGAGTMTIKDINAKENDFDVSSGKLEFTQNADFTANRIGLDMGSGSANINGNATTYSIDISSGSANVNGSANGLNIDIGSGSLTMDTAKTEKFNIGMSSGRFEVKGLSGSGEIDVSSGKGIAHFTDAANIGGSEFDVSSGSLSVYLPADTNAEINGDVSSGSIVVDCCGVDEKISDEETVVLGSGGAEISADVSSGKISFLENQTALSEVTVTDQ